MGYVYLILVALFFSFGGSCVKLIKPFFTPEMITFMRFGVGVLWLLLLKAVKRQSFRQDFRHAFRLHWKWLLFGAVAKWAAYMTENTALSIGVSYGNILTQPSQMVLLTVLGAVTLHEVLNRGEVLGVVCCVLGILLISWNGLSLEAFLEGNLFLTLLYVFSGCCAGLFVYAQKKVEHDFDILDSNLVMFMTAALLASVTPLVKGTVLPSSMPDGRCMLAIAWFGFVTGIGFYLNAKAIPLVPFHMVALLQSTMVFFALAWGILFFREPVSIWVILGTLFFVLGTVLQRRPKKTGSSRGLPDGSGGQRG